MDCGAAEPHERVEVTAAMRMSFLCAVAWRNRTGLASIIGTASIAGDASRHTLLKRLKLAARKSSSEAEVISPVEVSERRNVRKVATSIS